MGITKTYRRRFRMRINLEIYTRFAEEVIKRIENDTVKVFRPDDEDALDCVWDADGAFLLDAHASVPVSVREWLPVVCQFIRWESMLDGPMGCGDHEEAAACYRSNAAEVLWPAEGFDAAGPGALIAGILVRREWIDVDAKDQAAECDRLRFVLAHELVHAIHAMRFVVPAFMDWRAFWKKVLNDGTRCDLLGANHEFRSGFLDRYGTGLELEEVLQFWPSQGKRWFDAWQTVGSSGRRRRRG